MNYLHGRFLAHFVEQDVIGHIEADLDERGRRGGTHARGDRLRRPRRLHAPDRGARRRAGGERGRALRGDGRADAADRRARDQDARRRGDGRRRRPGRAHRLGRRLPGPRARRACRRRASASTTARRSTATATTTGARSTRPRASSRARPAARCSSRARSSTLAEGVDGLRFELIGEVGLKGFSEPTELFLRLARARSRPSRWPTDRDRASRCRELVRARKVCSATRRRPVVAMLSGGRDSVCLLDVAVDAVRGRRVSGAARQLRAARGGRRRRAPLRGALRAPGGRAARSCAPREARAAGNLQAWAREAALRGERCAELERLARRDARERRDGADRHRPHRQRPGRDDPLSPRRLARAARAAGDAAARGAPRAAAARAHARADRRLLPRAGPALARGREQRQRALRARARAPRGCCRRCARCTRRPRPTCCAPPSCCARRPSCSTALVDAELAGGREHRDRAPARSCPPALARLVVIRLAEQAAGAFVPQAGERVAELLALGARGGARRAARRRARGRRDRGGRLRMVKLAAALRGPAAAIDSPRVAACLRARRACHPRGSERAPSR